MSEDPITKVAGDRDWLKPSEVARILNAHITTVYRWIEKGQLPAIKFPGGTIWRIPRVEVEKALKIRVRQHKQPGVLPMEEGIEKVKGEALSLFEEAQDDSEG